MSDPEKKICRYFNTLGGCWYGDSCKFLHIPDKKPPCKFYGSSSGCRYGESCHFSHDRTPFRSVENYNNPPAELIKEVFKENVDPIELSGTNNNNMTQSVTAKLTGTDSNLDGASNNANEMSKSDATKEELLTDELNRVSSIDANSDIPNQANSDEVKGDSNDRCGSGSSNDPIHVSDDYTNEMTTTPTVTGMTSVSPDLHSSQSHVTDYQPVSSTNVAYEMPYQAQIEPSYTDMNGLNQDFSITPAEGTAIIGNNEIGINCGSCKRVLERRGNESYCTLLKDHYLECFLDKEGDHVKYVKIKAALEPGQMYWCKSCILIFEKPWSLFQHMADKAKGNKVQRWEKKIHLDWMDSVAGLMAGYDLGLFSPAKLRFDLRNLLADQHTMEEEMEVAAMTAATWMQWLVPLSSPWRLQQREMMRKIEQLNRQMLRKVNYGLNNGAGYPMRAAITAAPPSANSYSSGSNRSTNMNGLSNNSQHHPLQMSNVAEPIETESRFSHQSDTHTGLEEQRLHNNIHIDEDLGSKLLEQKSDHSSSFQTIVEHQHVTCGMSGDQYQVESEQPNEAETTTGASGDVVSTTSRSNTPKSPTEQNDSGKYSNKIDTNNTNSVLGEKSNYYTSARGDDGGGRRTDYKRGYHSAPAYNPYGSRYYMTNQANGSKSNTFGSSAGRYQTHSRGSRTPGYIPYNTTNYRQQPPPSHRNNRMNSTVGVPPIRGSNTFNPPSFHASMDFNCGFTDDEVVELLSQGIRPWDNEATAALAVLRGELDHLLD